MVSVVIPTYNGCEMLRKSLPTWFNQTLPQDEYEVFVVDNRSTDDTRVMVDQLIADKPNFHYLYESTPGATAARHAGAKVAKGEYLAFADNDGLFNPECLASIVEVYKQNLECKAVACKIDIVWDGKEPEWIGPYKKLLGQLDYGDKVLYNNKNQFYLNGGLMSVRKDVFERLGGFNPDLVGPYLVGDGDYGLVLKLHADNAIIGWAPNACMKHMQLVAKHGSKQGIALHYFNNGISDSYSKYRSFGFKMNGTMWRYLLIVVGVLCKKWMQHVLHPNDLNTYFSYKQCQGNVRFFALLLKPELRKEIRKENVYNG